MKFDYICFISAHLPAPNSKEAGQKLAYQRLCWLAKHYKIILLTFVNENELSSFDTKLYHFCAETHFFGVNNLKRLGSIFSNPSVPLLVSARYNSKLAKLLADYQQRPDSILFWYEYDQMCQYVPIKRSANHRYVVVCHDILKQMFERKLEHSGGIKQALIYCEKNRVERWEKAHLARCDKIISLSGKDKLILKNDYLFTDTVVLYPKIKPYNNNRSTFDERIILFWGAMNRMENITAVEWFVKNVWAELQDKYDDIRLVIMGANPPERISNLAATNQRITVTGFVESPQAFFESAYISIAPLLTGAGIKIKVLECLSSGVPVVGTDVAAEGIPADNTDGLIAANDRRTFLEQCDRLLGNISLRNELNLAAKNWYQQQYAPLAENEENLLRIIDGIKLYPLSRTV